MKEDSDRKDTERLADGDTIDFPRLPPGMQPIWEIVAVLLDEIKKQYPEYVEPASND